MTKFVSGYYTVLLVGRNAQCFEVFGQQTVERLQAIVAVDSLAAYNKLVSTLRLQIRIFKKIELEYKLKLRCTSGESQSHEWLECNL